MINELKKGGLYIFSIHLNNKWYEDAVDDLHWYDKDNNKEYSRREFEAIENSFLKAEENLYNKIENKLSELPGIRGEKIKWEYVISKNMNYDDNYILIKFTPISDITSKEAIEELKAVFKYTIYNDSIYFIRLDFSGGRYNLCYSIDIIEENQLFEKLKNLEYLAYYLDLRDIKTILNEVGEDAFISLVDDLDNEEVKFKTILEIIEDCEETGFMNYTQYINRSIKYDNKFMYSDVFQPEYVSEYPKLAWELAHLLKKVKGWYTPDDGHHLYKDEDIYEEIMEEINGRWK